MQRSALRHLWQKRAFARRLASRAVARTPSPTGMAFAETGVPTICWGLQNYRRHRDEKNLLALAVLALVSSAATAQSSVVLYGNVDLGVLTQNHSPAGGSSTSLANGGISPSIWGFRGSEDLGGGLKAHFNLEGHFSADTGASDPRLFRRQSNIGLSSSSLGTLTLGNQYSPAILAFAATDPRGLRENFSGLYPWAYNSGVLTAGNNDNNDAGVFIQNAVS